MNTDDSIISRLVRGGEPIRGYHLIRRLGKGGSGEVWKAQAPGGFLNAIKFVRTGVPLGKEELRSLDTMRHIRHPHLLPLFASWPVSGGVAIAMGLADRTLKDRLLECQEAGLGGIGPFEASKYLTEAAEALDHLNAEGVLHRDVKPANLLLVGRGLAVGDFGLARLLENTSGTHSGALTPDYAAPEFFEGRMHRLSDQYSLAATYFHLRVGHKLHPGNYLQVMNGHLSAEPNLSHLLPEEREPVARALAKRPEDRFPSCLAFADTVARGLSSRVLDAVEVDMPTMMNNPTSYTDLSRTVTIW